MPIRTRLPVDERRDQLLQLGLDLFSRLPYDSVSIDEIADAAGISRGLLYHYFPGKRDFYVAVVRVAVEELIELVEPDAELDPAAQLEQALHRYLAYVARRRHGYLTAVRGGLGTDDEIQELTDRFRARVVERVLAGLRAEPTPALIIALRAWVGYVETSVLAWLDAGQPDVDLVGPAIETLATNLTRLGLPDPRVTA